MSSTMHPATRARLKHLTAQSIPTQRGQYGFPIIALVDSEPVALLTAQDLSHFLIEHGGNRPFFDQWGVRLHPEVVLVDLWQEVPAWSKDAEWATEILLKADPAFWPSMHAVEQGWEIFDVGDSERTPRVPFEIQALVDYEELGSERHFENPDESGREYPDDRACAFVVAQAAAGEPKAVRALRFLHKHSPPAYASMVKEFGAPADPT